MGLESESLELRPEQKRRAILRVSTSLLNLILGPVLAWDIATIFYDKPEGGFLGLCLYVLVHLHARMISAFIASRTKKIANSYYKYSPILLVIAGILCIFNEMNHFSLQLSFLLSVVAVPILLGSYEGAYWCSYHGIDAAERRKQDTEKQGKEEEEARMEAFQKLEVLSTLVAAFGVIALKMIVPYIQTTAFAIPSTEILGCIFACMIAAYATIRRSTDSDCPECNAQVGKPCVDSDGSQTDTHKARLEIERLDVSPKSETKYTLWSFPVQGPTLGSKYDWDMGRSIAGMTGILQWSVQQSMRVVSLSSGGITLLSLFVAIAGLIGWVASGVRKKYVEKYKDEKATANHDVWIWSHYVALIGIVVMLVAIITSDLGSESPFTKLELTQYSPVWLFTLGWFIAQASISGSLRKQEPLAANAFLKRKANDEDQDGEIIGIRERMKFEIQCIPYSWMIVICYPFYSWIDIANFKWIAIVLLFWSIGVCLYNTIEVGPRYLKRLRSQSNKKSN